jgi:DNA-3-methyladenine glycosylase II
VRVPYRLDLSATVMRRLSTNIVDVFDGTTYRRLIGDPSDPTLLTVSQPEPGAVSVRLEGPRAERFDPEALVRRTLGTDVDLEPFYAGASTIAWLNRLAAGARGVKPPRYPTLWETIVNAVVYQQISIHAAGAILRRVIERYALSGSKRAHAARRGSARTARPRALRQQDQRPQSGRLSDRR